jgi:hypothetical protein
MHPSSPLSELMTMKVDAHAWTGNDGRNRSVERDGAHVKHHFIRHHLVSLHLGKVVSLLIGA